MARCGSGCAVLRESRTADRNLTRLLRYTTLPHEGHRRRPSPPATVDATHRQPQPPLVNRFTRMVFGGVADQMEPVMAGPLAGVVVVDFSQLAQGPFATQ